MKRIIGSHNSYHKRPFPCLHHSWRYTHPPLFEQLELGIRQFELDLHWATFGKHVKVQHVPWVDCRSNHKRLEDAYEDVVSYVNKYYSDEEGYTNLPQDKLRPIIILLEPKGDEKKGCEKILPYSEELTLKYFSKYLITQKDFLDNKMTWEQVDQLSIERPVIIVGIIDEGIERDHYEKNGNGVFFTEGISYFSHDDPVSGFDQIKKDVSEGKLVRTRGDENLQWNPERLQAAIDSGAQIISTDFLVRTLAETIGLGEV